MAAQLLSRALDAAPWFAQAVAIVAFAYVNCQPVLLAPLLAVGVAVHVISFASLCLFLSPHRAQPRKTIPPVPAQAAALASEFPDDKPGITIIKPIAGANDTLRENLESCFRLTYPKLELLFCLHGPDDKAVGVIEELIARYPAVDARLLFGEADLDVAHPNPNPSPNPKPNPNFFSPDASDLIHQLLCLDSDKRLGLGLGSGSGLGF